MVSFRKPGDIKVGVVGYGGAFNTGKHHLEATRKAGMEPVAVAEIDPVRLRLAVAEFPGIRGYDSVGEMLRGSEADLVVIVTPHNTHTKLGLQCLRAGRHVIIEKPLSITTAECDAMIKEAKKRRRVLSTYHNRHWDGCILEAVKRIRREEAIGEVYRIEARLGGYGEPGVWWRGSRSISGGILYDWGVHFLEYALQLIGSEIVEVTGYARTGFWVSMSPWKQDTIEDVASAVVRFKNGSWLNLTISTLETNPKPGWLEVAGTQGSYTFDHRGYRMIRQKGKRKWTTERKNPRSRWARYYRNLVGHLTGREKLVITPEWSRRTIHILDLAVKSARKGAAIKARYP